MLVQQGKNRSNSKDASMLPVDVVQPSPLTALGASKSNDLAQAAKDLEAAFLAEMLKSAGLGETPSAFGGGGGEDQFASFLRQEQAKAMVDAGGIGLAQQLFESLVKGQQDGS